MQKKLYRSRTSKTISGVCGGLGEYLNIDPTLVRVLWVLISIFAAGFPGLIAYVVMACVIPEAPEQPEGWEQPPYQQPYQQEPFQQQAYAPPPPQGWQPPPQGYTPPPAPIDYTQPAPPEPVQPIDIPPSE